MIYKGSLCSKKSNKSVGLPQFGSVARVKFSNSLSRPGPTSLCREVRLRKCPPSHLGRSLSPRISQMGKEVPTESFPPALRGTLRCSLPGAVHSWSSCEEGSQAIESVANRIATWLHRVCEYGKSRVAMVNILYIYPVFSAGGLPSASRALMWRMRF